MGSAFIPWINLKKVKKSSTAEESGTETLEVGEKPNGSLDGTAENGLAGEDKAKEAVHASKSESDLV